jgi:uncharacterized repeat protein (TIGR01451 family)
MSFRILPRGRRRERTRGQSLVEFALVIPILLLIFAAAADLGRAFYAYVAIENAAKEGAFFGARKPLCDDSGAGGCADPGNVQWRVRSELREQGIRNPDGTELTPAIACLGPGGAPRGNLTDCDEGDMYEVGLTYPFRLLTPVLGSIIGDLDLGTTSRAVVLNLAFDPTPGLSIQKFVRPTGATNEPDIIAKCLEPDDTDANGYYRSPCKDSSTADPGDFLTVRFEQGTTINYRLRVGNIGGQTLTGATVSDSRGATGCSFPGTMAVGFSQTCDYTRTAPNVTGSGNTNDYANTATADSAQTAASTDGVTVIIERPPARLRVLKWVSPFEEGGDGDGVPGFGTIDDLTVTHSSEVPTGSVWYKIIVQNVGGQTATGVAVTDTNGSLPLGTGACPALSTIAAGGSWECRYEESFSPSSPATTVNTANATATNVIPDGNDSASATVRVQACTGSNRTVPNLIDRTKTQALADWTAAGFTGTLISWTGGPNRPVVTQSRPAFECVPASSTMRITDAETQ